MRPAAAGMIGLRARHTDEPPAKLQRRLPALLLGEETALRIYGPQEPGP